MHITFVMPSYRSRPVGGFKIVYTLSNLFVQRGHAVSIVHPMQRHPVSGPVEWAKAKAWPTRVKKADGRLVPWHDVASAVELLLTPDLQAKHIPEADVIIATAWHTANLVANYPESKGRKFYFIQHHETWDGPEDEVNATWQLPLHRITTSTWLMNIGKKLGVECDQVPYGLDFSVFRESTPIAERDPMTIGMLYHDSEWKGAAIGTEVFSRLREDFPSLRPRYYGAVSRPGHLPDWIDYVENPHEQSLADYYNSCAIFLCPSWTEGWGMPGFEASACGCALVSADTGGVQDYTQPGKTALIVPPKDPDALAGALRELLEDNARRIQLANAGREFVSTFTWDLAADKFLSILSS